MFEVVRGPCGPRMSILGLITHFFLVWLLGYCQKSRDCKIWLYIRWISWFGDCISVMLCIPERLFCYVGRLKCLRMWLQVIFNYQRHIHLHDLNLLPHVLLDNCRCQTRFVKLECLILISCLHVTKIPLDRHYIVRNLMFNIYIHSWLRCNSCSVQNSRESKWMISCLKVLVIR